MQCCHVFLLLSLALLSATSASSADWSEDELEGPFPVTEIIVERGESEGFITEEPVPLPIDPNDPTICPTPTTPFFPEAYLLEKSLAAIQALHIDKDLNTAQYNWAKVDEIPGRSEMLLQNIISSNYSYKDFQPCLDFLGQVRNVTLQLQGYHHLLDAIISHKDFSMARGELFHLAHHLKSISASFPPPAYANITNRFSQGIKATVFEPFFTIKNIHDSYVFHLSKNLRMTEEDSSSYWCVTGKCKRCNESHLLAEPATTPDFSLFILRNPHLGEENCLGVKNGKAIVWVGPDHALFCGERERWNIRFVGKTLAKITYQPVFTVTSLNDTESARGFGLTRTGFNKHVTLESTGYLNSNQIWLTT